MRVNKAIRRMALMAIFWLPMLLYAAFVMGFIFPVMVALDYLHEGRTNVRAVWREHLDGVTDMLGSLWDIRD